MWLKYIYWINKSLTNECTIIPSYRYLIIMQQNNNCCNNITLNKVINLIGKCINVKQYDNCINVWSQSYIIWEYEI